MNETHNVGYIGIISCTNMTVKNVDANGILMINTTDSTVLNVDSTDCNRGVLLSRSSYNDIINCDAYNNLYYGIELYQSSNNSIINCNAYNNMYGISLGESSNCNVIHHNNLVGNTRNAHDVCSNTWDDGYPSGGNYWDDYNGSDDYYGVNQDIPGSDGIGDTPYNIPYGDNQDRYPLMEPWGTPPEITNVSNTPDTVGFGFNVTISATVIDNLPGNTSGVDIVKVNITYPDSSTGNFTIDNTVNDTYEYIFNNTWKVGQYNYTIWAVDKANNSNSFSGHSFNVSAQCNVSIQTLEDEYVVGEAVNYVNITDPPDPVPDIGWELLDDNTVLHIWNTKNEYYFDTSSGVQLTNHYNEYWSHNVLMLGYYNNDEWNLIYRTDELSGFNKDIETDNETYINATLWKYLSYQGYDFRLAVRYHLGVNDNDLTVIPYIKNLGQAISYTLGFGWEINDIKIADTYENDWIRVNDTQYRLDQDLDIQYKNLTHIYQLYNETTNETSKYAVPNPVFYLEGRNEGKYFRRTLYLKWNSSLDYLVRVKSRDGQHNAPVSLFIKIGTLSEDQEKSTQIHWLDSDDWLGISGEQLHSYSGEDTAGSLSEALNGTSAWIHSADPVHWFIVDLGKPYVITQIKGRSNDFIIPPYAGDPDDVNVYVYNGETAPAWDSGNWGTKVNPSNITTWVDTNDDWQFVDTTYKKGRYIKVEILSTDTEEDCIEWGNVMSSMTIFDACTTPIESKIDNTGDTDCKGYLLINVEYNDGGTWILENDTINESTPRTVTNGTHLKLDEIFNDNVNTSNLSHEIGQYRVYVAFRDPNGKVLINDDGTSMNASYEFNLVPDTKPPEITDITLTPSDPIDTEPGFGWENITCIVNDNIEVDDVKLNVTYPDDHTEEFLMNKTGDTYYYNVSLADVGNYSYYIWANDTNGNVGESSSEKFSLPPNWDINMDGMIRLVDFVLVAGHYGENGPPGWIREDVNNDGMIRVVDLVLIAGHYGESWYDTNYVTLEGGETIICILPSNQTVEKNETFNVSVYVEPSEAINGVAFDYLYFNASLIHANSVTKGDLFDPYNTLFNTGVINNTAGVITYVYGLTIPADNTVTESGYFVNISFTALQEIGISSLELEAVVISNADEEAIHLTVNNGNVTVQ